MRKRSSLCILAAICFPLQAAPAFTSFTHRSVWEAAAGSYLRQTNFDIAPGTSLDLSSPAGGTLNGSNFTGTLEWMDTYCGRIGCTTFPIDSFYDLKIENPMPQPGGFLVGPSTTSHAPPAFGFYEATIQILIQEGTTAFGTEISRYITNGRDDFLTVRVLDNGRWRNFYDVQPGFFGLVADRPFTRIEVSWTPEGSSSQSFVLDNVAFASDAPEPGTFLPAACAAVLMVGKWVRTRSRRR